MSDKRHKKDVLGRWVETQPGRPQFRAAPSAGLAISKVMRPLAKKHGGGSSALALEKIWPDIVGPRWSKISSPVRFLGGRDGRTLIITAPGAASALILAQSGPIVERLNAHLGSGHVRQIKVIQSRMIQASDSGPKRGISPRKASDLNSSLSNIDNPKLKAALEAMGRGVLSKVERKL